MELHFEDFELTIKAVDLDIPYSLIDEALFLTIRSHLINLLADSQTEIFHFGLTRDNTADGQDELMENGVFYRISGYEKNLGLDLESSPEQILNAFHYLVSNFEPKWTTIFVEEGLTKKEVTVELMYQEVF